MAVEVTHVVPGFTGIDPRTSTVVEEGVRAETVATNGAGLVADIFTNGNNRPIATFSHVVSVRVLPSEDDTPVVRLTRADFGVLLRKLRELSGQSVDYYDTVELASRLNRLRLEAAATGILHD